jgi:hypothetical protein
MARASAHPKNRTRGGGDDVGFQRRDCCGMLFLIFVICSIPSVSFYEEALPLIADSRKR